MAAWPLFAFGGAYFWTTVPLIAGAVALAVAVRPAIAARGSRAVDLTLLACLLFGLVQLLPLPRATRDAVSPAAPAIERELYLRAPQESASLTIDRQATGEAVALAAAVLLVFWCARSMFGARVMRRTLRIIALCGLAISALAIIQHATAPSLLYWTWRPLSPGASPYTPFVSKNDLAAWLVMAIPLTLGYIVARIDARRRQGLPSWLEASLDDQGAWLIGAACAMTAALIVALSRSGLIAFAAGLALFVLLARSRMQGRTRWLVLAGAALLAGIAIVYGNANAMLLRLNETLSGGIGDRRDIWLVTRRMIADFRATGVGVGAFERAMSVYQPPHLFAYNHAHNEYLQIAAEGGLLLAIPVTVGLVALCRAGRSAYAHSEPLRWMRLGAAAALVAVAVQAIWETGLTLPANSMLAAVAAAILVHTSRHGANAAPRH